MEEVAQDPLIKYKESIHTPEDNFYFCEDYYARSLKNNQ